MLKYKTIWKGFDQGVEHTWEEQQLIDVLQVLKRHEPFSWSDPDSPIYPELDRVYPQHTWFSKESGEFRPLFRRSNTWMKLALIEGSGATATVSEYGNQLFREEIEIRDVLISACRRRIERAEKPFAIICSAFIDAPSEQFSISDIYYGIMGEYRPGVDNITEALNIGRRITATVPPTHKRRLRNIMRMLERVGGVVILETKNWCTDDLSVLGRISETTASVDVNKDSGKHLKNISASITQPTNTVRHLNRDRGTARFSPNLVSTFDPVTRALLLEKATNEHEATVKIVGSEIIKIGGVPLEDPFGFDIGSEYPTKVLFEIKSWNKKNLVSQLRKAVAQLPEYRWSNSNRFPKDTLLAIVLASDATGAINDDYIEYLTQDRGLLLFWVADGIVVDHQGNSLSMVLTMERS